MLALESSPASTLLDETKTPEANKQPVIHAVTQTALAPANWACDFSLRIAAPSKSVCCIWPVPPAHRPARRAALYCGRIEMLGAGAAEASNAFSQLRLGHPFHPLFSIGSDRCGTFSRPRAPVRSRIIVRIVLNCGDEGIAARLGRPNSAVRQ